MIQDADLEYATTAETYNNLLRPLINNEVEVVYGSRFLKDSSANISLKSKIANRFLTFLTNFLYNGHLTDMGTCYKIFKADVITKLNLNCMRFEFEPEITVKLLKRRVQIKEIPISYTARSRTMGKKIGWKDGLKAVLVLIKYKFYD